MALCLITATRVSPLRAEENTVTIINGVTSNAGGRFILGNTGTNNTLSIINAGVLVDTAAANTNSAFVTGSGSVWTNTGGFTNGLFGSFNALTISDSGKVYNTTAMIGQGLGANSNIVTVTGAGRIAITDGTISHRNVSAAPVFANVTGSGNQIANISFAGNNTFRLNNSSNATGVTSYTFDPSLNPTSVATNYTRLELVNGTTLWRSGQLTLGSGGGGMLVSNTTATVAARVSNSNTLLVVNSTVSYLSNFVNVGRYISDPSTNVFSGDLTVTASGSLEGGLGDVFDFKNSFFNQSTNAALFNLAQSTVSFSGGNAFHTNSIAGDDYGPGQSPGDKPFSYYLLKVASANDQVYFTSGVTPVTSNALYVWQVELPGNDTNFVANLRSPFNIYYATSNAAPQNAYLLDLTYSLTGGGFLLPAVPEPSALLLAMLAGLAWMRCRRRVV